MENSNNQTCATCLWWRKKFHYSGEHCANGEIDDMIAAWADDDQGLGIEFRPPADFSCSKWSPTNNERTTSK